ELVSINQGERPASAFQLQLRKAGSEAPPSDLGVYRVAASGYPVQRWWSRGAWEERPEAPDEEFPTAAELDGNFRWLVSSQESRLVTLVAFFQQNAVASTAPAE